ncbi:MAG: dihydroorotate dehydrogenase electron transfer subunit [Chloroflexota bacterium]
MKQVIASVTQNRKILPQCGRERARTMLQSRIIGLKCPQIAREAKPGQYVMVRCGNCTLPRPFSLHGTTPDGEITLYYAVWEDGKGTDWLSRRHKGDSIEVIGPLGNGFTINAKSKQLLLVAGGIGIAPMSFLAQAVIVKGHSVTLLVGAQTTTQLYPRSLLPKEAKLVPATDDGTAGKKGRVTDLLPDFVDQADQVFSCGPMAMYQDMHARRKQLLKDKPVQVSLEVRMGCGRGVCYGCTIKTKSGLKMVCQDGPVFDLDEVRWDEPLC